MSFRSLMSNKIAIYRKGLGVRDDDGYETASFELVEGMSSVPSRLSATSRSAVYRLEGVDVRASHQLYIVSALDDGSPVNVVENDRVVDEETGVAYRVLEIHAPRAYSKLHHFEGAVIEETSWAEQESS